MVFPWLLSDVTAGKPVLLPPYIELAKYAAQMRNYQWQEYRKSKGENPEIKRPDSRYRHPYPGAKQEASDSAVDDRGGNFGRIARPGQGGLLNQYMNEVLNTYYLGIKLKHWIKMFKPVAEGRNDAQIESALDRAVRAIQQDLNLE